MHSHPKVPKIYWYGLLVLTVCAVLAWYGALLARTDANLHVSFFDVGQGDAAFITTPAGAKVLVDGGPDASVLRKLGERIPFFDRSIDLVILSHPHADHINGVIEALKRYRVKNILLSEVTHSGAAYQILLDLVKQKSVHVIKAVVGQKIILDANTSIYTLYPPASIQGQLFDDLNETSVISRLVFGKNSVLFTGDSSFQQENELLASSQPLSSQILKVGHHGSKKSTGKEFLQAVKPQYAVISVGEKNRYGHPAEQTLDLLSAEGVKILRTDKDGDVEFTIPGDGTARVE